LFEDLSLTCCFIICILTIRQCLIDFTVLIFHYFSSLLIFLFFKLQSFVSCLYIFNIVKLLPRLMRGVINNCLLVDCRAQQVFVKSRGYEIWPLASANCIRSKATRFRWIQTSGHFDSSNDWALTHVYIGDGCDCSCAGRGRCHHGKCMLVSWSSSSLANFKERNRVEHFCLIS